MQEAARRRSGRAVRASSPRSVLQGPGAVSSPAWRRWLAWVAAVARVSVSAEQVQLVAQTKVPLRHPPKAACGIPVAHHFRRRVA